jgi:hypothetical protein
MHHCQQASWKAEQESETERKTFCQRAQERPRENAKRIIEDVATKGSLVDDQLLQSNSTPAHGSAAELQRCGTIYNHGTKDASSIMDCGTQCG